MILGRFGDTTGRPYIEARIALPRLRIRGLVSFLADTGADKTALMPIDGQRLGIDYSRLSLAGTATGIGGTTQIFHEQCLIAFRDSARLCIYQIQMVLQPPTPDIATVPSLLGRDVMGRWCLTVDKPNNSLCAIPATFDHEYPLPIAIAASIPSTSAIPGA